MSRGIQLAGWFAATNAVVLATALAVGLGDDGLRGVTSFVAWCGLG